MITIGWLSSRIAVSLIIFARCRSLPAFAPSLIEHAAHSSLEFSIESVSLPLTTICRFATADHMSKDQALRFDRSVRAITLGTLRIRISP